MNSTGENGVKVKGGYKEKAVKELNRFTCLFQTLVREVLFGFAAVLMKEQDH